MARWVRVSTINGPANASDEQIHEYTRVLEGDVLPQARQLQGFQGIISVTDRETGKSLTLTFWENEEALRASEDAGDRLRKEAAEATSAAISHVDRYEVTLFQPPT